MYKSVSRSQFGKIPRRTFWVSGSVLGGEVNVDQAKFQTVNNEIKNKDQEEQRSLTKEMLNDIQITCSQSSTQNCPRDSKQSSR